MTEEFQRVKTILECYPKVLKSQKERLEKIHELQTYGRRHKSKSISSFSTQGGFVEVQSEADKTEQAIEELQEQYNVTERSIIPVKKALKYLRKNVPVDTYNLLVSLYGRYMTIEEIAEESEMTIEEVDMALAWMYSILESCFYHLEHSNKS